MLRLNFKAVHLITLLCLLTATAGSAWGEEETLSKPQQMDQSVFDLSLTFLENSRDLVAGQLVRLSDGIDTFFSGDRIVEEGNGTQLRLRPYTVLHHDGSVSSQLDSSIRVDLPRLNKKLSLVIENKEQEVKDETGTQPAQSPSAPTRPQPGEASSAPINTALQLILKETQSWNVRASAGISFDLVADPDSGKVADPNASMRFRRLFVFRPWEIRFTEKLYWYASESYGSTTTLDFERPFSPGLFFRATTTGNWEDYTDVASYDQSFYLYHNLDASHGFVYHFGVGGNNASNYTLDYYTLTGSYRQRLYKNWLYWDSSLILNYPRTREFKFTPALVNGIEIMFDES